MNKLYDLAVSPSELGMSLVAAATPEEARALIGAGTGGGGGGAVDSVNGKTGDVTLTATDVGAVAPGANISLFTNDAGYLTDADIPGAPVLSVNGQTGTVVLTSGDVGAVPTGAVGTSVASLVGGKVPNAQIPPLAITSTFVVSSQAAQLALVAEEGDVCVRTDLAQTFIKTGTTLGTMADWQQLLSPTAPVQSVNGKVGVVSLSAADVGAPTTAQFTSGLAGKADVPGAWTNAVYENSFETYPGFGAMGYRATNGRVDLRGTARSIAGSTAPVFPTVFTLPVGMRPAAGVILGASGELTTPGFSYVRVDVGTDGTVKVNTSATSTRFLNLDGLFFYL